MIHSNVFFNSLKTKVQSMLRAFLHQNSQIIYIKIDIYIKEIKLRFITKKGEK